MYIETRLRGAREVAAGLTRVSRSISTGSSSQLGRKLANEGLRVVVRLTPRQKNTQRADFSKRGHAPFHKQWTVLEKRQTESRYEAVIRNKATDTVEGFMALASVEFGAKAHTIAPRVAKRLAWFQPGEQRMFVNRTSPRTDPKDPELIIRDRFSRRQQDEAYIFARVVDHPGHRSFRMVQETRDHLNRLAAGLLRQYAKEISREFGGGFQISIT